MRLGAILSAVLELSARRHRLVIAGAIGLTALTWGIALLSLAGEVGRPFPGFFYNPDRVVSSFTPETFTGWQAGLRPWDVVVAVNGQHWREMSRLVQEAGTGGTLVYTVVRGGERLDIAVPTMEFSADIPLGILPGYFLLALVFLTVGVFVYARNPSGPLNVGLLFYLLVWSQGGSVVWECYLSQGKLFTYALLPYAVLAPVVGWVFLWSFPADETRRKFLQRWPLIRVFVWLSVASILFLTGMRMLATMLDHKPTWDLLTFVNGWPYFVVFGLGTIPLKGIPLAVIVLRSGDRLIRQQAEVTLLGLVLGLSGWFLFVWAPAAIHVPPLSHSGWGGLVPILYPVSIGYAILRYQMLNIRVVVRKGLIYSLLTATLTAIFLLFSLLSGYLLQGFIGEQTPLAMLFPALLVAFLFQPARSRIQALVDRSFFRPEAEVRQTLTQFSRGLSVLRERDELVRLVLATVTQTLGTGGGRLWLAEGGRYLAAGTPPCSGDGLQAAGALAAWMEKERRVLLPRPDDHSAAAEELRRCGAVLAVPLLSGERLVGILTLPGKGSGDPYSGEDLDLLDMLAHNTALALENARMHEERLEILRQQFNQATAAQEKERRRIARELHDGVGPSLASLRIRLHTVHRGLEREQNPAAVEVRELAEQVHEEIRDIRRLIDDLRPAALDQLGLAPALREYAARYQADQGIEVELTVDDDLQLSPALEITLFRIAQESLANVAKHAWARRVEVRLERDSERATLLVRDDGRGFEPTADSTGSHVGLWSMQKRAEQLGGEITIRSSPGQGTLVGASFPLQPVLGGSASQLGEQTPQAQRQEETVA